MQISRAAPPVRPLCWARPGDCGPAEQDDSDRVARAGRDRIGDRDYGVAYAA